MKKYDPESILIQNLQFAVLLIVILGLSGFRNTNASAQSSESHYRDTTLNTPIGRPTGTIPGCIDSDIIWTSEDGIWTGSTFNNVSSQGEVSMEGYIVVNEVVNIYGITQGGAIMFTTDEGNSWNEEYSGGSQNLNDVTCLNYNGELHWYTLGSTRLYEIANNNLIEKLYLPDANSLCSNMTDTIYIARGSNGIRGYSINNWNEFDDMTGDLEFGASIDWKDNYLLVVDGLNVWSRSTNPSFSWTELVELDPSGQWTYCTWLVDPSANQLDLAVGSATFDKIQVWREIVAPNPEFIADETNGYAPLTVQFTDQSTGQPSEWLWDFGDGNTSNDPNPTHIYQEADSYTVSLTVSNGAGSNTMTKEDYITVNWLPMDAQFTANPEFGIAPLTVQFTDQSSGNPTSWEWNFGDGGVSTLQNPEYTYTVPGTYTVSLTVYGPAGEDTQEMVNLIVVNHPLPIADFEADPTGGTTPLDVSFVNLSLNGSSYFWDFGDGNTSTEMNPEFVYESPGVFTVTLTVENPDGVTDEMVKEDYITVVEPAQVVITSFTGDPAGFISRQAWNGNFSQENGETAEISSSLGNQYSIDFNNGTITSNSISNIGEDLLSLTLNGANGSDTQDLVVPVYESHNLLADTIGSQNIQILTQPTLATPDLIEYELHLPMQDFYSLYDFSFLANNQGAGIQDVNFEPAGNTLTIDVSCNTTSNYQTFSILQKESGASWFENGQVIIFPDEATLALLSENISNFVYPGEELNTKIFTGTATTWTITNETYNEVVYTDSHSSIGITEKNITVGSWTLGPILEQTLRIDISSPAKTVSRYFPMDGTTGIVDFGNEIQADRLGKIYPNPFSDQTNIPFSVSTAGNIKIEMIDINGVIIRELLNEVRQAGNHLIKLESASIRPGVYLLKMTTVKQTSIKKLTKF